MIEKKSIKSERRLWKVNPSLVLLRDEQLMEVYERAKMENLSKDFIQLLEMEIERRKTKRGTDKQYEKIRQIIH
ncbi:MAG: sporulation histidine kinase inhibitor Sda [Bacillales bacterium]|nr:sporulation histidine kinase inhibitor Sda [Bacillales bacterium]